MGREIQREREKERERNWERKRALEFTHLSSKVLKVVSMR